ncbi:hypothetical protein ACIBK9_46930 [Nonomuraea sp. NPDC050227]|uniref:hypothetical protein n=1 Tax=Nonomuraea sp. NPDC050227 TaxID=3364360 RepID=UPI0037932B39
MRLRTVRIAVIAASLTACSTSTTAAPTAATPASSLPAETTESTTRAASETPTSTRQLTGKEKAFIRDARKKLPEGYQDATDEDLISFGHDFCGQGSSETIYDDQGGNPPNVEGIATYKSMIGSVERSAVLHFCPKYIKTWKQAMGGFDDGEHQVGGKRGIKPGRYRTLDKGLKGCYWERVSKGGETLANNLVTYAPGYITVTILPTDGGFSSGEECYFWVPADL